MINRSPAIGNPEGISLRAIAARFTPAPIKVACMFGDAEACSRREFAAHANRICRQTVILADYLGLKGRLGTCPGVHVWPDSKQIVVFGG